MPSTVYVGIVTYNSLPDLPPLLRALSAQTYSSLVITLLDNASTDGTREWLRTNANHLNWLLLRQNLGFGRGHNRILQLWNDHMQPTDFYLALNPDVIMQPDYIERLVAGLQATNAGWGTGKLIQTDTKRIYSAGHALYKDGYAFNIGYGLPDDSQLDEPREVFGAPAAAALYRKAMIDSIALDGAFFDPLMFMYGEDVDVDWRARLHGWQCRYVPDAVAYHRGSHASAKLRTEALANRYLSVMRNADRFDYYTYNLPRILLHCAFRLLVTPRLGAALIGKLSQYGSKVRAHPTEWRITPATMRQWFAWSSSQPTAQPHTLSQRLRSFFSRTPKR
ncbi:MAG: glycosyltransferase family 2 protein [Anaerolineae bacterium]|nr:glycosyltransferase family 2 protein [Anaerolineae bacterium]